MLYAQTRISPKNDEPEIILDFKIKTIPKSEDDILYWFLKKAKNFLSYWFCIFSRPNDWMIWMIYQPV